MSLPTDVPIINISPLVQGGEGSSVATQLEAACRDHGFFYVSHHGVDEALTERLATLSHQFFAQEQEAKLAIRMERGGRAWRGYFPVGGELTSGQPDQKEGLYFGTELRSDDPRVRAKLPMHGPNLFPDSLPDFRPTVLEYMQALTQLGHTLMRGVSLSLGLPATYFADHYTTDPLTLFRIFHYPPVPTSSDAWGVGEHTDYGLLTILKQDDTGGLQIKSRDRWIDAPPVPGTFICNIGDMLERLTRGRYRSTPHRVRNVSHRSRYSFPFFFDPHFNAPMVPPDLPAALGDNATARWDGATARWDGANVHDYQGTYGDYILRKVSHVFPDLQRNLLD